jgi:hypothetical protein
MKVLGFFSLLLGLVACTPSPETKSHVNLRSGQGVVGGLEVENGSPFAKSTVMITLDDDQGQSFICTGTFISEKLILTASHCATPNPLKMSVLFGLNPLSGRDYSVVPILKVHWYAGVLEDHSKKNRQNATTWRSSNTVGACPRGPSRCPLLAQALRA